MSDTSNKEYRYVGMTPDTLENGRPVEFGTFTGPIPRAKKNLQLIRDGLLLEVPDGTAEANAPEPEPEPETSNINEVHPPKGEDPEPDDEPDDDLNPINPEGDDAR